MATLEDKSKHRQRVVNVLVYASVGIILVSVLATLLGSDMTQVSVMYGAYVGMTSLVVVGHFATNPTKDEDKKDHNDENKR